MAQATFILRHTTRKTYAMVCADLMESNERFNVGKEKELIQLEQKSCSAMCSGFELSYFIKSMLQAHNGLSSRQSGVSQILLRIYRSQTYKQNKGYNVGWF